MIYDQLLKLIDESRITAPWIEWAKEHRVSLNLSHWVPHDAFYVLAPSLGFDLDVDYTVVAHPEGWRRLRKLFDIDVSNQRLAEIIAWQSVDMKEPGDAHCSSPRTI